MVKIAGNAYRSRFTGWFEAVKHALGGAALDGLAAFGIRDRHDRSRATGNEQGSVRRWIARHGGLRSKTIYLGGRELTAMFPSGR